MEGGGRWGRGWGWGWGRGGFGRGGGVVSCSPYVWAAGRWLKYPNKKADNRKNGAEICLPVLVLCEVLSLHCHRWLALDNASPHVDAT